MNDLQEIEGVMKTDKNGNLMIASKALFDDFFKQNKSSSFTYKVVKTTNKSRKSLFAYYYAEVIPKIIKGYNEFGNNFNKSDAVYEMVLMSKVEKDNIEDFNYFELKRHISECIIFAAEHFTIQIEEPI